MNLTALNEEFQPLSPEQRIQRLYDFFEEEEVLLTSSFGVNSAVLLHLASRIRPGQKIHFIDTRYHFAETLAYRQQLTDLWKLQLVEVQPDAQLHDFTRREQSWQRDPDLCCGINKVAPLDAVKARHKLWFSGLMAHQTRFRAGLNIFEQQGGLIKFHPLIDMSEEEVRWYKSFFRLPPHPLSQQGYGSVGCTHCTQKGAGRAGRWNGKAKTECGLHTRPHFLQKHP
ncbi:MAG: phosphoadenylyl-sulfate reductase [Bacteroidetes bacterium]|nr:MAG: phosphoadenylyl-sulfate reductase [Bacteroidota bacterium]